MINCGNCGQSNAPESNFCRYCGVKFGQAPPANVRQTPPPRPQQQQRQRQPEVRRAPRPYSWKTDELKVNKGSARQTRQIENLPVVPQSGDAQLTRPLVGNTSHEITHGYRCPRCSSNAVPHQTRKISSAGWIVFAVLLVFFFPLFWIGFLMKEDVIVCPVCNFRVN
ncbi:MAG: hypothetical protein HKN33_11045 [Pyrinomonadaceae bacterium]|nr:hypothetical protein [Pyrinomonadaceae bacterium]